MSNVEFDDAHVEAIFDLGLSGVFLAESNGSVIRANDEACRLLMRPEDELHLLRYSDLVAMDDPRVGVARARCREDGQFVGAVTMVRGDGTRFEAEVSAMMFTDSAGRRRSYVFFRDISERVRSEQALLASEHRYRTLIETTANVIVAVAPNGIILEWNAEAELVFGYTRDEAVGHNLFDLIVPADQAPKVRTDIARALTDETVRHAEHVLRARHAGDRVILWNLTRLLDISAQPIGVIASGHDITQRSRAEEASRQQREILQKILDHIPLMVAFVDERGRVGWANKHLTDTLGWPIDVLAGQDLLDALFPDEATRHTVRDHMMESTQGWRDFPTRTRDGRELITAWASVLLSDGTHIGIGRDVTDHRRAEEERTRLASQMQHAQKLESLGVLAGGIAHDFNNLLVGMLGNASLALMDIGAESPLYEVVKDIETTALRAADLTKQMLAYSGRGRFVVRPVDLSALVEEMANLLHTVISKRARLVLDLSRELPHIEADATQIRQIVMNMITNASDALGDETGDIFVRTGIRSCDRGYLRSDFSDDTLVPGLYAWVEVQDTGLGMAPATLARIFEPFFSTKFTGRGLGLAATIGIVRGHRGAIKVSSTPGVGTIFRVLFPVSNVALTGHQTPDEGIDIVPGTGLVLVVDDDPTVRAVARNMLERRGYSVVMAADGAEGLRIFGEMHDRLALAFVDLTMPNMGGEETIRAFERIAPSFPTVLMSGFSEQELAHRMTDSRHCGFIQKPFRIEELDRALRRALHAEPPAAD
ncbi:MAG: Sensor histidine kinase RcsC [Gemmatimonadaceae bacterium]|nr:Sensor histidine kinase RcsC [Gemmatimonadaceae bacterium]